MRALIFVLTTTLTSMLSAEAFTSPWRNSQPTCGSQLRRTRATRTHTLSSVPWALAAKDNGSDRTIDEEDDKLPPGMAEAFRRLESLESLGGATDTDDQRSLPKTPPQPISADAAKSVKDALAKNTDQPPVSLEKEAQLFQSMAKELEGLDEQSLYDSILASMETDADSSSNPDGTSDATTPSAPEEELLFSALEVNDNLMKQALAEALDEIEKENPSATETILNDKELMKEIEAIFERGNEKLMQSLADIRKEQTELARASATEKTEKEVRSLENESRRIDQAEASVSNMLRRVNDEAAEVKAAVEELKRAQTALDRDFLYRLKSGGVPKQAALVGFLLFSVRSIVDSIASLGDETYLIPALAQGAIAVLCAAYFFLI